MTGGLRIDQRRSSKASQVLTNVGRCQKKSGKETPQAPGVILVIFEPSMPIPPIRPDWLNMKA